MLQIDLKTYPGRGEIASTTPPHPPHPQLYVQGLSMITVAIIVSTILQVLLNFFQKIRLQQVASWQSRSQLFHSSGKAIPQMSPSLFNVVFKHNANRHRKIALYWKKKKTLTAIYTIHLQNCQFKSLRLIRKK